MINPKKVEIFFGTGGVGKTTVSASRALTLVQQGKKVLLMTIDPAKRLKDIFNLTDDNAGTVSLISSLPEMESWKGELSVLLMSATETIKRMSQNRGGDNELSNNRIVKILSRPFGGMNEILSLVELEYHLASEKYDCIVLDTPPGPHFLDFLQSIEKMKKFFESSYVEIFTSLNKDPSSKNLTGKLIGMVMEKGIQKLISYLDRVTGKKFIQDFLDALEVIYNSQQAFMQGIKLEKEITNRDFSNWFLVTSTEQGKVKDAMEMLENSKKLIKNDLTLILNKSLKTELDKWDPKDPLSVKLKDSFLVREESLQEFANKSFKESLIFNEVISISPLDHIKNLAIQWRQYV